jgi:hypothetical protein
MVAELLHKDQESSRHYVDREGLFWRIVTSWYFIIYMVVNYMYVVIALRLVMKKVDR